MLRKTTACLLFVFASSFVLLFSQPVFTDAFPPEEYAARRTAVMRKIGDAVAILQGTTERPGEQALRQANQFFYLTGVVEQRAILVIDGASKTSTLFLNPANERREKMMFGPGLSPGPQAVQATGIEAVLPRDAFKDRLGEIALSGRAMYTPFRPEVLGEASSSDTVSLARATKNDPWDGRISREDAFIGHLKIAAPQAEIKDLDQILDLMRSIKSAREIAAIQEATRITGLGILEAMKDAKPGLHEYELQADAEFIFKKYGAYGASYFALIATGKNTFYSHYHKGTATLQDGDLVQFDYAPDYKNYSSDVTRVFPANGRFSPWQREYYTIYLRLYQALMTSIQVHSKPSDVIRQAVVKMDKIVAEYQFTDPKIKNAAIQFVERYRSSKSNSLGHNVGMEVHDVRSSTETLEPGQIFTIEPAMQIPDLHLGIRLEDMLLITDTGYQNMSAFVPVEIRDIEITMKEHGLSEALSKRKGK